MTDTSFTDLTTQSDAAKSQELALATKGTANFHQNIQLLHGQSDGVQQGKGRPGEFLFDDNNLGKDVKITIVAQRFHAIYLKNKQRELESFDSGSAITKKIVSMRRSYSEGEDPRYGYSFLVYLPELDKFAVYHPNVPSARPVAKDIIDYWTPPDKRTSEGAKQLPFTNCLILSSFLRESRNPHYVPKVTPVQADKSWQPNKEEAEEAIGIFSSPVFAERSGGKVEEAKSTDDR